MPRTTPDESGRFSPAPLELPRKLAAVVVAATMIVAGVALIASDPAHAQDTTALEAVEQAAPATQPADQADASTVDADEAAADRPRHRRFHAQRGQRGQAGRHDMERGQRFGPHRFGRTGPRDGRPHGAMPSRLGDGAGPEGPKAGVGPRGKRGAQAQQGPGRQRGPGQAMRASFRDVNLTDEQQDQVRDVLQEATLPMQQYMAENAMSFREAKEQLDEARDAGDREAIQAARERMRDLREAGPTPDREVLHDQIRALLTEQQQAVFDANVAELRERGEQMRQRREQMRQERGDGEGERKRRGPRGEGQQRPADADSTDSRSESTTDPTGEQLDL